jgi:hypothetical protein
MIHNKNIKGWILGCQWKDERCSSTAGILERFFSGGILMVNLNGRGKNLNKNFDVGRSIIVKSGSFIIDRTV